MLLTELKNGETAVMLAAPDVFLPHALRPGRKIQLLMTRPELSVVYADGTRFAISAKVAQQIVVVRAPT